MVFAFRHKTIRTNTFTTTPTAEGSPMHDSTGLEGGVHGFCDRSCKAFGIKTITMGGGRAKIVQKCVTSIKDDP